MLRSGSTRSTTCSIETDACGAAGRNPGSTTIVSLQRLLTMNREESIAKWERELNAEYNALDTMFCFGTSGWHMIHEHYSGYMFCPENRRSLIGQYLVLQDFVGRCHDFTKETGRTIPYYLGIDTFLEEYKRAVEGCLKNLGEEE